MSLQNNKPRRRIGRPLPDAERIALQKLLAEFGDVELSKLLGTTRFRLARAAAGLDVQTATAAMVREALRDLCPRAA